MTFFIIIYNMRDAHLLTHDPLCQMNTCSFHLSLIDALNALRRIRICTR